MELPFLHGPLPEGFRRRRVVLAPGRSRPFDAAEWRNALVVVEHGRLHLECHNGGFRAFGEGAIVTLDGLALRALHNHGPEPTVLVAVDRRSTTDQPRARPRVVELPARPYLGTRRTVTTTAAAVADRIPEIVERLAGRGLAPAGTPFLRYHVIEADGRMEVEAGVPVDAPRPADGDLRAAVLPAGRFVVSRHSGDPDGLVGATAALLDWAAAHDLRCDRTESSGSERWGCRTEHFLTREDIELVVRLR